jgi:hypothetical protein
MEKLKVVVTNPKTKEEYDKMIDDLNESLKNKYSGTKKDLCVTQNT